MARKPKDARGAPKGHFGNPGHKRDEEIAILVGELASYGMPLVEISLALNAMKGGGFSLDTLRRHYGTEIEGALEKRKGELLRRAHKIAMGEDVPTGVTPDAAFREASSTNKWLLSAVHRVRDGAQLDFGAGTINVQISRDDAEL